MLSLVISILNSFAPINIYDAREFLGIIRTAGIIGEPNFTAFAMLLPWIIFLKNKNYSWLVICTIPLCWTLSRSILIFAVALGVFLLLKNIFKKLSTPMLLTSFVLIYLSPIIFKMTYELSPKPIKKQLISKLSTRFYLTSFYTDVGINNLLGAGLSNGRKYFNLNGAAFKDKVRLELDTPTVEATEQHSVYSQIISEFGIVVYFLLLGIMLRFRNLLSLESPYFLALLTVPAFINSLNELTLFVAIAYFMKKKRRDSLN